MSEADILRRLEAVENAVRANTQILIGPPGRPNGLIGDIATIKQDVKDLRVETHQEAVAIRSESHEESKDVRKAVRNLIFAILISGVGVVIAQLVTQ